MNTIYFLNNIAGNVFGTETTTGIPDNYYLGLSSTEPNKEGEGVTEPSTSAAYARVKLENLSKPTNGVITNTSGIDFNESTDSWGTVTHFVIYDAPTGGHLLMYGELSVSRSVEAATIMTIKTGALNLSVVNPAV